MSRTGCPALRLLTAPIRFSPYWARFADNTHRDNKTRIFAPALCTILSIGWTVVPLGTLLVMQSQFTLLACRHLFAFPLVFDEYG